MELTERSFLQGILLPKDLSLASSPSSEWAGSGTAGDEGGSMADRSLPRIRPLVSEGGRISLQCSFIRSLNVAAKA